MKKHRQHVHGLFRKGHKKGSSEATLVRELRRGGDHVKAEGEGVRRVSMSTEPQVNAQVWVKVNLLSQTIDELIRVRRGKLNSV